MRYDLEHRGSIPLYDYLYRCIRDDILSGTTPKGTRLPSKRELARDHGIAVITVENAYAQLLAEGYIVAKPRSGYYVAEDFSLTAAAGDRLIASEKSRAEAGKPGRSAHADKKTDRPADHYRQPDSVIAMDYSSNRILEDSFPFSSWSRLMRRVLTEREGSFLQSPPAAGVRELREAIADYLLRGKGLHADPDRIIVGPGTEYLHTILLQLVGTDAKVAVEDPGYKKIGMLYEHSGHPCIPIPVDEQGIRAELLEGTEVKLVHTSPSHHFPTGCVLSAGRRIQLLDWAHRTGAYIIEDDYDSELRFLGRPIPPLTVGSDTNVIYMNTFTHTLAPSIRIAYMVLPEALMDLFKRKLSFYSGAVSSFDQYTLAAFLREGYYERHISRMRNYYRGVRSRLLRKFAASGLSDLARIEGDQAGLSFVLEVLKPVDHKKFREFLEGNGLKISPITVYCYVNESMYRQKYVINYAAVEESRWTEALALMEQGIRSAENEK